MAPVSRKLRGWRWYLSYFEGTKPKLPAIQLYTPTGRCAATVFLNLDIDHHNWYIWDEQGVNGENSGAPDIPDAMKYAEEAMLRSGWHGLA